MSIKFENSNTKINLLKAFAGESQARNRYTFAASQAQKDGLQIIGKIFTFTANQEKEHAKLFYKKLAPFCGENIKIEGGYPVDLYNNTLDLLKCAKNNEYEEYNDVYKSFGEEAKSEGFDDIADIFMKVSKIEKVHGDRFNRLIENIENGTLFESSKEERWICLNCGEILVSKVAPKICTVCDHPQGYQIREEWIRL